MFNLDFLRIFNRGQIHDFIFFNKKRAEVFKLFLLPSSIFDLILFGKFCQFFKMFHVKHHFPSLERYTSSTEISAGVTPEMRDACPIECGLNLSSFCPASRRSPLMLL